MVDDLLGPAEGPYEWVVDMGVRDRYLVGKLAPQRLLIEIMVLKMKKGMMSRRTLR